MAEEPSAIPRTIVVMVTSQAENRSCSILVSIFLINDNPPIVNLSGSELPDSTNFTVGLNYSFLRPQRVSIAAPSASISDRDAGGRVASLLVQLVMGRTGDRVLIGGGVCPEGEEPACYLR